VLSVYVVAFVNDDSAIDHEFAEYRKIDELTFKAPSVCVNGGVGVDLKGFQLNRPSSRLRIPPAPSRTAHSTS